MITAERKRLEEALAQRAHWRRWGPYLSDRAWGTVREDYSAYGSAWNYFPHDHARSRAYRWSEDGLLGLSDNHQRLCFALALWNGRDPILKERLFGLDGNEGNHSEDVKELYYYLDSTPTHSYMKALYKYPQSEFPYARLLEESRRRTRFDPEFELLDTGVFDGDRYFDVFVEYAKAAPDDILILITVANRGPEPAALHLLPTVWFRNTWSWNSSSRTRPAITLAAADRLVAVHPTLGTFHLRQEDAAPVLFTENETNFARLFGMGHDGRGAKDAFHRLIVEGDRTAVHVHESGTKAALWNQCTVAPGESRTFRLRLQRAVSHDAEQVPLTDPEDEMHRELAVSAGDASAFGDFDSILARRKEEADEFYSFQPDSLPDDARSVQRQAFAGLLWSKQYFHYVVEDWLNGDPGQPAPPEPRQYGRNKAWRHLYADDILTMPDKWEYPWFAAWDTAFHDIVLALVDPDLAKRELGRFLREWYMHPSGQIPAYEWAFSDVNPPVHAWASWRVFQIDRKIRGKADHAFLESVFHKLLLNFTWWVNRKDSSGDNIFEGGFLGLDNIGVFDRSAPLPTGGKLEQSDGTSWMAMFCLNMLRIALELACFNPVYEDIASKFFEHFLHIASAMNSLGGNGLWNETDGFYYDHLHLPHGESVPMRVRSMVGLIPLFAVDTLEPAVLDRLPGFRRRMEWFIRNRPDLCANIASITREGTEERRLLAICHADRLHRVLAKMLDETEFLSPHGIRSLSRYHKDRPFVMRAGGADHKVDYQPAESTSALFGGNSNWRGPVWFPVNYLMIESLQRFHHYYGDDFRAEFPTGSGNWLTLSEVASELSRRLSRIFLRNAEGRRPVYGGTEKCQSDPHFRDLVLFFEYFHGDDGAGLGASHQTGWTALVAKLLQQSGV